MRVRSHPKKSNFGMVKYLGLLAVFSLTLVACETESRPGCEETSQKLRGVDERGPLSFSLGEALSNLELSNIQVTWGAPDALADQDTTLTLSPTVDPEDLYGITATRNDYETESPLPCGTRIEGNVAVHLKTQDDRLDVVFEGTVAVAEEKETLLLSGEVEAETNAGNLEFSDALPAKYSLSILAEEGQIKSGSVTALWPAVEGKDGKPSTQMFVTLLEWGTAVK